MNRVKRKRKVITPKVFQAEHSECGAAALAIILRYYGCWLPTEQIRYECGVSRDGCSAADMILAARHFGLDGKGYCVELEKLAQVPKPCIIHWDFDHFVVLEGVGRKYAYINDPASGHRRVGFDELDRKYTGVTLCFCPTKDFVRTERPSWVRDLLERYYGAELKPLVFLLLAGLAVTAAGLFAPFLTRSFIDNVIYSGRISAAKKIIAALAAMYLFQSAYNSLRDAVAARLNLKISALNAERLLRKMLRLPMLYYEQRYAGELSRRLECSTEIVETLTGRLIDFALDFIQIAVFLTAMFFISPKLALIGTAGILASAMISAALLRPYSELSQMNTQERGRLTGMLCAGIKASDTIKAAGAEEMFVSEVSGIYARSFQSSQRLEALKQVTAVLPAAVAGITSAVILIRGAGMTVYDGLSVGSLTAFLQFFGTFASPVSRMLGFSQTLKGLRASYAKLEDIEMARTDFRFSGEETIACPFDDSEGGKGKLDGRIDVDGLTFGYNISQAPVVDGFSMSVPVGNCVAIVGPSGCGKSTVAKLMDGILSPWSGEIRYDGVQLKNISELWFRASVAMVSQNGFIFDGTVGENICAFRKDVSRDSIIRAAADADALDIISSFPEELDHRLESGGKSLSGGQRQKIVIARALAVNPAVLILDEATSALDSVSEKKILENIRARGCTCIIISHRISAIRDCDRIIVMNDGRVTEAGGHDELMAAGGTYSRLVSEE